MTQKIDRPDIYYIQHPLADGDASDQLLASYSDEDIAEYRSEYEEYRRVQSEAVTTVNELMQQTREYFKALFGDDTKQMKYLDRSVRNNEMFTDQHARMYPRPERQEERILEARKKYCSFLSDENAPKIGGEDTLQEINNAVTFLLDKGLVLNTDFTVSNAVALAVSVASETLDDALSGSDSVPATHHNIALKGVTTFPRDKYSMYEQSSYIRLRCDELEYDPEDDMKQMVDSYLTYSVSFKESSDPQFLLCEIE